MPGLCRAGAAGLRRHDFRACRTHLCLGGREIGLALAELLGASAALELAEPCTVALQGLLGDRELGLGLLRLVSGDRTGG